MVLSLDTEVDTSPDSTPWEGAATAMPLPRSLSKPEDTATLSLPSSLSKPDDAARLSGMIININKVINLFIRYKT